MFFHDNLEALISIPSVFSLKPEDAEECGTSAVYFAALSHDGEGVILTVGFHAFFGARANCNINDAIVINFIRKRGR